MSTYFLTGATGTVGSALAAHLLEDPQHKVFALVRSDSADAANARLIRTLSAIDPSLNPANLAPRLRAIVGDATLPRFGASENDHAGIIGECTHIVHCAGAVRMNLPLADARREAVNSAANVIELARHIQRAGRLSKVEMLSTVGVAGRDHALLPEDWVGTTHRFHNTYEQSKAEAEGVIRTAVEEGMPITVHRPSMVVGDSRTGRILQFQVFYFLAEFLSGRRTRGLFPHLGNAQLDLVPVDVVARAVARSSHSPTTAGRIFHLCAGPDDAIALERLRLVVTRILSARGGKLPVARGVSPSLFRAMARALSFVVDRRTRAALRTLPVFLDYLDTNQRFAADRSHAWLAQEGIVAPRIEAFLPTVLDYYFDARPSGAATR